MSHGRRRRNSPLTCQGETKQFFPCAHCETDEKTFLPARPGNKRRAGCLPLIFSSLRLSSASSSFEHCSFSSKCQASTVRASTTSKLTSPDLSPKTTFPFVCVHIMTNHSFVLPSLPSTRANICRVSKITLRRKPSSQVDA